MTSNVADSTRLQLTQRPRRNRKSVAIRDLCAETQLLRTDLVMPFFLLEGEQKSQPINSMPGIYRFSLDLLLKRIDTLFNQGLRAIAVFPVVTSEQKSDSAEEAINANGLIPNAIRIIKNEFPELCLITDIALDPYTSHGHDGLVDSNGSIINDKTVHLLGEMAVLHAEAGVDIVAPSDMMDGRVGYIRDQLDVHGFEQTSILSYSAKYASSLYSPFREALSSSLSFGDKRTYQMNPANAKEALLGCKIDDESGADILMVKPASLYLDIISKLKQQTLKPVAAYHVSGEYAMVLAAQKQGFLDANAVLYETLLSIKRAGADWIFTYAAERLINNNFL